MGMSTGQSKAEKYATPSINITPLVDIVLVVLIIFMLVTPMMTKTFWMNLPPKDEDKKAEATPPPPTDNKPVVMVVDKQGAVRVNNVPFTLEEIKARLPRVMAGSNQRVLYFDAHDDAPYSAAVEAMDASRASGVGSIALLTEKVAK